MQRNFNSIHTRVLPVLLLSIALFGTIAGCGGSSENRVIKGGGMTAEQAEEYEKQLNEPREDY